MKIKIELENENERQAADSFLTWLCEAGEQDYWNWMDVWAERGWAEESGVDVDLATFAYFQYDFEKLVVKGKLKGVKDDD